MYAYTQPATAQNSYTYSTFSPTPYYCEMSNSSYSEQFSAYNNILTMSYLSRKMQQLDICKQKANERLFRKTGKRLSAEQASLIDSLILCNYTKKPLVSFYEDKIKVQIDFEKKQYMLDYDLTDFDGIVLVGTYKNSEYTVEEVPLLNLQNVIRG